MNDFIVAIDGPAGSGKSSISKMVSKICGFTHIDTGAIFRAITLYALDKNINLENENEYNFPSNIKIRFDKDKVFLNDNDVSHKIREDIISKNVWNWIFLWTSFNGAKSLITNYHVINPDIIKTDPDTMIVELTNDSVIKSNESGIIDTYLKKKGI